MSLKFKLFLLLDSSLIIFLKHEGKVNLSQTKLTSHLLYLWFSNALGKIPETLMDFMHLIHVKLDLWFIQLQYAWVFSLWVVARNIVNLLISLWKVMCALCENSRAAAMIHIDIFDILWKKHSTSKDHFFPLDQITHVTNVSSH